MRKLIAFLVVVACLVCIPVWAQKASAEKDDLDLSPAAGGGKKQVNADAIISRIRDRKAKVLTRLKQRFERLPERLQKMEERVENRMNRAEKKPKAEGAAQGGTDRKAELKAKITERYEKFKTLISERKNKMGTKFDERKTKFQERMSGKLKAEELTKVMAEFESAQKEIVVEVEKMLTEAQKKLDETYQKLMSKLN